MHYMSISSGDHALHDGKGKSAHAPLRLKESVFCNMSRRMFRVACWRHTVAWVESKGALPGGTQRQLKALQLPCSPVVGDLCFVSDLSIQPNCKTQVWITLVLGAPIVQGDTPAQTVTDGMQQCKPENAATQTGSWRRCCSPALLCSQVLCRVQGVDYG